MLPPGPKSPAAVQTWQWASDPLRYLTRARARFGRMWTSRLVGFPPLVHISDPALIRETFTGNADVLCAGEANRILKPMLGPSSLFILDGEMHLRERRLLLPLFNSERMQTYAQSFRGATERMVDQLPRGKSVALFPYLQDLTLRIVMSAVFGSEEKSLGDDLKALVEGMVHPVMLLPFAQVSFGPWRRLMRLKQRVHARIDDLAENARADTREDILALLVRSGFERSALRDELVTLLVAGHDTVATALAWTIHHLLDNPDVLERAQLEADRGETAYLDAVAKEALRMTPVLPIVGRFLTDDLPLGGYRLPRGVRVAPNAFLTHHDPELWPEPQRFDPQRFIGVTPHPYSYLPFGGGVRRCIGMAFALAEMRAVLGVLLHRLTFARGSSQPVRAVRRGVVLMPSASLRVVVHARR